MYISLRHKLYLGLKYRIYGEEEEGLNEAQHMTGIHTHIRIHHMLTHGCMQVLEDSTMMDKDKTEL